MALLYRIFVQPFRKVWSISIGRCRRQQHVRGGRYTSSKLYKQVKSCSYHDIQVMWSLLQQQEQQRQKLLDSQQSSF
ncbi:hypothetical protein KP509_04G028600 [Ceratopteris richardii]|uniref:Uncharacterized protein n=1 Tax=Ceratopteris richardii TaxID=49495 RepID=A0A8T2UVL2_CERRI|nr:hypothetical protein KP509_04G028600 [Ceratopteris richardii]